MLPVRAVRYCEAVTSATAFGWWIFPPVGLELLWDGTAIFWRCDEAPDWMPLQPSAQMPNYVTEFDAAAPESLTGFAPPFLTALPEPGTLQMWTGLFARTAADWHLLVRAPANMPPIGGLTMFEGIIETDRWFGPLFANMRFTRSHMPIRMRLDYPLVQAQPIKRECYSAATLESIDTTTGPDAMTDADWAAYHATIVEPNSRPNRPFGSYGTATRKKRHRCQNELEAAAGG
jgi:hypothetical protein